MDRTFVYTMAVIGILAVIVGKKVLSNAGMEGILNVARAFLQSEEGFSATPYWDVSRWSWGYGTQAPGPGGTIDRDTAADDMMKHVMQDYDYLKKLITMPLTANQWGALLSFSYNLGPGNADNLVDNINRGDYIALGEQWNKYVYAGGVINSALVGRRQREWELFIS